jgi:hypothetical protein
MKQSIIIVLACILVFGCRSITKKQDEFSELYRQRLPNSSKVIYYFSYWGSFVTSRNYTGYSILDSTETFTIDKIKKIEGDIALYKDSRNITRELILFNGENHKTDKDTIDIINHKDNVKISKEISPVDFDPNLGISFRYSFEGIIDKADSITFYGVKENFGKRLSDRISFKKIGMFVDQKDNILKQIIFRRTKLIKIDNKIKIGTETLEFFPKDTIMTSSLPDYGYFKRIK